VSHPIAIENFEGRISEGGDDIKGCMSNYYLKTGTN
jgi:hypothetical protein